MRTIMCRRFPKFMILEITYTTIVHESSVALQCYCCVAVLAVKYSASGIVFAWPG